MKRVCFAHRKSAQQGRLLFVGALHLVALSLVRADEPVPDDPRALAARAVEANPAILSLKRQIAALEYKARAAVVWSDPVLSIEYSNVPWSSWALGDSPMSGMQFKIQQTFTLPGKNDRRREVVQDEQQVQQWALLEQKNQLRSMIEKTYWRLGLVRSPGERIIKVVVSRSICPRRRGGDLGLWS